MKAAIYNHTRMSAHSASCIVAAIGPLQVDWLFPISHPHAFRIHTVKPLYIVDTVGNQHFVFHSKVSLKCHEHFQVLWAFSRVVSIFESCEHFQELWAFSRAVQALWTFWRVVNIFKRACISWAFWRVVSIFKNCSNIVSIFKSCQHFLRVMSIFTSCEHFQGLYFQKWWAFSSFVSIFVSIKHFQTLQECWRLVRISKAFSKVVFWEAVSIISVSKIHPVFSSIATITKYWPMSSFTASNAHYTE